jgi:hypothetical protein
MKNLFTKKRIKALKFFVIILGMGVILLFTIQLIFLQATYKPCTEYSSTKYGEPDYVRIKGVTYDLLGVYSDGPALSCSSSKGKTLISYEEKGKYSEKQSCTTEKNDKSYIETSYEDCQFGCYGGLCMDQCYDSDNSNSLEKSKSNSADTLTQGEVIGSKLTDTTRIIPGVIPKESQKDYCTNENNTVEGISYYVAEQTCGENNFIEELVSKCDTFCFDGACQKENITQCYDSDKGDIGQNVGEVKYYDLNKKEIVAKPDTCTDAKTVTEYFCGEKDKKVHKLILTCRYSCSEGACTQPTNYSH